MRNLSKGKKWPSEIKSYKDSLTGVNITQLTDHMAHSFHLYFTNNGWYDDENKMLIVSDRDNQTNLFSVDLLNGELIQLTDLDTSMTHGLQSAFINPVKPEVYFTVGDSIIALNLKTYEEKVIFTSLDAFNFSNLSCTADGKHLCFGLTEDMSSHIPTNLSGGYIGFEEMEAAKPYCQIHLLHLNDGMNEIIHEDNRWIGHVNASPTVPHLITFCHEGPWSHIDHRIWLMDLHTRKKWKIREGKVNEYAGHEYWLANGTHIGYHGYTDSLEIEQGKFFGTIKYDNSECDEYKFPYQNMHIHSNERDLIVGDGQQSSAYGANNKDYIFLWEKSAGQLKGPLILCRHRCSFHVQKTHVHPRFSPDGKKILFTSDQSGYGQVYMVEVPDLKELPHAK